MSDVAYEIVLDSVCCNHTTSDDNQAEHASIEEIYSNQTAETQSGSAFEIHKKKTLQRREQRLRLSESAKAALRELDQQRRRESRLNMSDDARAVQRLKDSQRMSQRRSRREAAKQEQKTREERSESSSGDSQAEVESRIDAEIIQE